MAEGLQRREVFVGSGGAGQLALDDDGAAHVVMHPHPPYGEATLVRPLRHAFTADGTTSGSQDMRVAGSSGSPVEFWIPAHATLDSYIMTISFVIADASASLSQFGNISALTNGVRIIWESDELGSATLAPNLRSNWDFVRLCHGTPAIGSGANCFRANNVAGASEGYIPFLSLAETFGLPFGLKLAAGSGDKIVIQIRDDTTTIDAFDAIGYGTQVGA